MSSNITDNPSKDPVVTPPISKIDGTIIESDIPARLDRLPWTRFHWLVVVALGITWILDGLEVTLAGTLASAIRTNLGLTNADVGFANTAYLLGAVFGALYFGWRTDRLGRKKLFFITLIVYMTFTAATALSWNMMSFVLFRFLTGAGIGGEYAAINSTIQELIPARYRGVPISRSTGHSGSVLPWEGSAQSLFSTKRSSAANGAGGLRFLSAPGWHALSTSCGCGFPRVHAG